LDDVFDSVFALVGDQPRARPLYSSAASGVDKRQVKAVSVRVLEGDIGTLVLAFNLYLAPFDVWTGAITATAEGAQISTADNSCRPQIQNPQNFFPLFPGGPLDLPFDFESEREGHIEIIEMGIISDSVLAAAATHENGVPSDCDALETAWQFGNQWFVDASDGIIQLQVDCLVTV